MASDPLFAPAVELEFAVGIVVKVGPGQVAFVPVGLDQKVVAPLEFGLDQEVTALLVFGLVESDLVAAVAVPEAVAAAKAVAQVVVLVAP